MQNVTVNVGIMATSNLNLKPVRGKKLPLKVKTTVNYDDLKKRAIEKHSHHDQSFCCLEEYFITLSRWKRSIFSAWNH